VETLAQFGSIFLLFCHGMMYTQNYHISQLGGVLPETFAAGVLILSGIFFVIMLLCVLWAGSDESES
jgi:Kef-type K+ transport system membrane component KefB